MAVSCIPLARSQKYRRTVPFAVHGRCTPSFLSGSGPRSSDTPSCYHILFLHGLRQHPLSLLSFVFFYHPPVVCSLSPASVFMFLLDPDVVCTIDNAQMVCTRDLPAFKRTSFQQQLGSIISPSTKAFDVRLTRVLVARQLLVCTRAGVAVSHTPGISQAP